MRFFKDFIKGIFIGAGAILPGISSGVLCVIFGIYDKLVQQILGIFKHFKESFLYLLPIVFGSFVGIVLFGNILKSLLNHYPIPTKYLFIGLILGSIPMLLKRINSTRGFRLHYIFYTLGAFLFGLFMVILEKNLSFNFVDTSTLLLTNDSNFQLFSFLFLMIAGFFMSIGIVVPGVSSTIILMCFGIYDIYLFSISTMNLSILVPLGIGVTIGGIVFLKLIEFLLDRFYMQTFYSIIGFTLGSIFVLYEAISFNVIGFTAISLLILGFYTANFFEAKS